MYLKKLYFASIFSAALVAVSLALPMQAFAAPCCGVGSAVPSIIAGDDRAQLQAAATHGSVIGDAPDHGLPVFRGQGDQELTQTLRLDGAYRLFDRYQVALGVPVVRRVRSVAEGSASATGVGDITVSGSYEILPEWNYSVWRPHGFVFLTSTLAVSPSTYDAKEVYQIDARGRGFYSIGLGTAFFKTFGNWDVVATAEAHRSFARTAKLAAQDLRLTPGFGASGSLGGGFSPWGGRLRLGLSVAPVWEGPIRSQGLVDSTSNDQLVWNTSAQLGFQLPLQEDTWSSTLTYTDQTLLGPTHGVTLSRIVSLAVQKRWAL